ncbi:MAG: outer membrane protein assembly factor BamA [Rickettsiales bacterium]|nr:outer membrane protein assembly factor BamA [Rickettsiales bacterium]RPG16232.1 MAG: outer membrane protein assembly factor BamA [Pelagibacteraceae bacterium TMED195]
MKNYFIYFFTFFFLSQFFLCNFANSQSPGTPSSSYNFDYHSKGIKNESQDLNILEENFNAVTNIIVQGNKRLESNLIINESQIESLGVNEKSLSKAVKNLYKTGYFEDVQIFKDKNYIYINVKENPVIDLISVEGNTEISDELILEELTIKTRNVYSIDVIKSDADTIETLYKRQGFFSTYVEPKIIKIDDGRVNLVFEVYEGKEAKIKRINFINNKVFSDSTLKDVISSTEFRWYEFWGSNDKFDKDRINYDKDLLKKYYYDNGYIDFRIISVNSSLVDNRKDFVVNFSLYEGNRYKVSDVNVRSNIRNLQKLDVSNLIEISKGDWYSSVDIDESINNITEKASELGYAFVEVYPVIKKRMGFVDLTFEIEEGKKIFINRINISGNLKTVDKVIRRELELVDGDPFNSVKLRQSERNVNNTALFEGVEIKLEESSDANKANVEVEVKEKATGQFSVGGGFSSLDGAIGNVSIKESNLFGEAKEISLALGISTRRQEIDLSYTNPYFLDKDVAAGIDLFNVRRNNKRYSGYKHNILGFRLRSGYEIINDVRHFSSYTLKRDKIHDISNSTSRYIQGQEGKRVTSIIGQAVQYSSLNDRINPTEGTRVRLDLDYYGLIGDSEHFQSELKIANFFRIADGVVLGNFIEGGYILPIKDVKINDRFFINGDRLRGFKNLGVGPRDSSTTDALGGEIYYLSRNELTFPLGLPDDLGVSGLIFGDIGSLFSLSESGSDILDENKPRASAGIGISWLSPFGPVKFYLSKAILKENYDKKEIFRFSFGTTY